MPLRHSALFRCSWLSEQQMVLAVFADIFFFGVQSKQKPPVEKVGGSLPIAPYILGFLFLAVGCLSRFCPVFRATPCALIQWLITPDDMPRVPVWCQQLLTVELNLEQRSSHVPCQILRGPYLFIIYCLVVGFLARDRHVNSFKGPFKVGNPVYAE